MLQVVHYKLPSASDGITSHHNKNGAYDKESVAPRKRADARQSPGQVLAHVKDKIQQFQVQTGFIICMEYYNTVAYNNIT